MLDAEAEGGATTELGTVDGLVVAAPLHAAAIGAMARVMMTKITRMRMG